MRQLKEELVVNPSNLSVEVQNFQQILCDCLKDLNDLERKAIFLRFWQPYTICEVARELKTSWEQADILIDTAVSKLRRGFQNHPHYKRPFIMAEAS